MFLETTIEYSLGCDFTRTWSGAIICSKSPSGLVREFTTAACGSLLVQRIAEMQRVGKLIVTAAVALVALRFLASASPAGPGGEPYKMVDELVPELDVWGGKSVKVHGWVEAGSIAYTVFDGELHASFLIQKAGQKLRVFARGALPDSFRDRAEVVVTGQLVPTEQLLPVVDRLCVSWSAACPLRTDAEHAWVLEASAVSGKCISHYDDASRSSTREPDFK